MSQFYSLPVASVSRSTRDAVVVAFTVPEDLQDVFQFRPGQYLTLRTHLDGQELRRSYSICAAPHDRLLRVAIKRVNDGAFSTWANSHLEAGATLEVMPPDGNFTVDFDPSQAHRYAAFAVGSGITPILSLVKTALDTEPKSTFTLFFGNRASSAIMFREEIEDLKNTYMERFSIVYIMSRETQDIDLFNGRLDGEKVRQLMQQWFDPASVDVAFVCGPQDMSEQVVAALQEKRPGKIPDQVRAVRRSQRPTCTAYGRRVAQGSGQGRVRADRDSGRHYPQPDYQQKQQQHFGRGTGARAGVALLL